MLTKQKLNILLPLFLVRKNSNNKLNSFMIFKLHFMYFYRGFFLNIRPRGGGDCPLFHPPSPPSPSPWQRAWEYFIVLITQIVIINIVKYQVFWKHYIQTTQSVISRIAKCKYFGSKFITQTTRIVIIRIAKS